jgi:hypothetical protein
MEALKIPSKKPKVKLTGHDGNVFHLIGLCYSAMAKKDLYDSANEMKTRCFKAKSYDEALQIMSDYCILS